LIPNSDEGNFGQCRIEIVPKNGTIWLTKKEPTPGDRLTVRARSALIKRGGWRRRTLSCSVFQRKVWEIGNLPTDQSPPDIRSSDPEKKYYRKERLYIRFHLSIVFDLRIEIKE